jgi:antitoxin (DNA-binding transcriptional repressor) of toxin-antitoxin stability system
MTVSVQYAESHLAELAAAADAGQEVEISRPDKPALKLVVATSKPKPEKFDRSGMFGWGKGKFVLPAARYSRCCLEHSRRPASQAVAA